MYLEATIENEAEFTAAWGRAVNTILQGVSRGVMMGVKEGAREAREHHTFRNRSGDLEESIEGFPRGWVGGGWKFEGEIRAGARYASFVEYPTKGHFIPRTPKPPGRKGWLHWEEPQGDHHFAKQVWHPGTKGQPFMFLAYYKCERVIYREIEIAIVAAQGVLDA